MYMYHMQYIKAILYLYMVLGQLGMCTLWKQRTEIGQIPSVKVSILTTTPTEVMWAI